MLKEKQFSKRFNSIVYFYTNYTYDNIKISNPDFEKMKDSVK